MRLLLIIGMLLGATSALASDRAEWNPPARFDHAYSGELTVRYLPQKQVVKTCAKLFAQYGIKATATYKQRGCAAITSETTCLVVVVDKPHRGTDPEAVVRHEMGHCNGWDASHPD